MEEGAGGEGWMMGWDEYEGCLAGMANECGGKMGS